jgi:hypothetical protein
MIETQGVLSFALVVIGLIALLAFIVREVRGAEQVRAKARDRWSHAQDPPPVEAIPDWDWPQRTATIYDWKTDTEWLMEGTNVFI